MLVQRPFAGNETDMSKPGHTLLIALMTASFISCCWVWLGNTGAQAADGFEFSIAKHRDAEQGSHWSLKLADGAFVMTFNWKP